MDDVRRLHIRVGGRVQGVGFRYFTQREATRLGLVGYVRNMPDGDVEMEAEGPAEQVAALAEAVRRGPAGSHVRDFRSNDRPAGRNESDFEIRFF
ncbi:MAG: acylphosphatase [Candidatus Latescibacteria bacterium]|nr:acylphosphatase [Candidatus Latescibacterota bacterium]